MEALQHHGVLDAQTAGALVGSGGSPGGTSGTSGGTSGCGGHALLVPGIAALVAPVTPGTLGAQDVQDVYLLLLPPADGFSRKSVLVCQMLRYMVWRGDGGVHTHTHTHYKPRHKLVCSKNTK